MAQYVKRPTKRTPAYIGALKVANTARELLGLPPVDLLYPGNPKDPFSCAITETVYDDDLDRSKYIVVTHCDTVKIYSDAKVTFDSVGNKRIVPKDFEGKPTFLSEKDSDLFTTMTRESRDFIRSFDQKRYRTLIKKDSMALSSSGQDS